MSNELSILPVVNEKEPYLYCELINNLTVRIKTFRSLPMAATLRFQNIFRLMAAGAVLIFLSASRTSAQSTLAAAKPRIVVTADPELDDNNSLIRFLLYSSDLDI